MKQTTDETCDVEPSDKTGRARTKEIPLDSRSCKKCKKERNPDCERSRWSDATDASGTQASSEPGDHRHSLQTRQETIAAQSRPQSPRVSSGGHLVSPVTAVAQTASYMTIEYSM